MNFAASSRVTSHTWGKPNGLIGCPSSRLKSGAIAMGHTQKVMADPNAVHITQCFNEWGADRDRGRYSLKQGASRRSETI